MRPPAWTLIALLVLTAPTAAAEWGHYGPDGWPVDVDGRSTSPRGPVNVVAGVTVYPYWPILTAEIDRLAREHPDLVRVHSAGRSTAGLDLWMIEIADFDRIESGEGRPLETREVVWVDGGTHSNEYSGVYFTAHLASFLLDEYGQNETATWIVENRHTWIMPLVNPDGSHAFGRLNAKGVNINRNYPVAWGALAENPLLNNPGPAPASEVETQINIAWFNQTRPDLYVSIHCCGNLWLYPYGVEGLDPVDKAVFERVCDEAFPAVREDCGPIWSTIYPASGSSVDTAYEYAGAVAFGYEMSGRGAAALWGQPLTTASVREQEVESWEGILHGFRNVERYGAHPVATAARIADGLLVVTVANDGYGPLREGEAALVRQPRHPLDDPAWELLPLPPLEPGESAELRFAQALSAGPYTLRMDYVQREMAQPRGVTLSTILVREAPGGFVVESLDGAPMEPLDAAGVDRLVPGPSLVLLASAALVAAGYARRR